MSNKFNVTRRSFLQAAGVGSGALVFGSYLTPALQAQGLIHNLINGFPVATIPVLIIKVNGDVVIITHRPEMGQGIRSSLAAVLADEMEADWKRVTLKQADADAKKYAVAFPAPVAADVTLPFPFDTLSKDPKLQYLVSPEGSQFTDSSRSMTAFFTVMRLFGAGLRLALVRSAAKKWGVDEKQCRAEKHRVYGPRGQSSDYRWLLLGAMKETPSFEEISAALKKPEEWRYIGKGKEPMPFYDAVDLVRGKAVFGADVNVPGMLTASIERCPVANGALLSYDATPALAVEGVRAVLPIFPPGKRGGGVGRGFMPHAGVAVIATNTWAALQGRRALKHTIKWNLGPHATYDSAAFRTELENSTSNPGNPVRKLKDVDDAFTQVGADTKEAHYYVPHLAQTPMEPPVAVALFQNGKMEVWAPTQAPDYAQIWTGQVALGIDPCGMTDEACNEKARQASTVHLTMLGGGFGRKSKPDYVVEAAILAKQMPGVPIRVQWTREDDIKFSYYNAVSSQYLKASLGADKLPSALLQRSALTSFFGTLIPNYSTPDLSESDRKAAEDLRRATYGGGVYPYASGIERAQGLEDMPYDIPNLRLENCKAENHIRVGWMRSVANVYHAFAINSFAGELAIAAGRDQKDYLLDLIGKGRILDEKTFSDQSVERFRNNELPLVPIEVPVIPGGKANQVVAGFPPDTSRLHAVINQVAAESDWTNKVAKYKNMKGRGLGIAAHRSFLSYVAVVVDVSLVNDNELTINDVYATIHCGLAVNRDRVLAQMEGGVVYGLSYALLGEITVKNGAVVQNNFDDYPVLRIHQTPRIHVSIVDSNDPPTGVGEPPTPAVAPALANAIAAAGGPRIRAIPFATTKAEGSKDEKVVLHLT
ncbi:MAG TPA: molybdopterin cofactor-binding domain-containing protein [Thermoanaerobaculia bacterium]|jgi:isoquinoline 1-oxidoreductase beta subunit|nr:molybdopterin cofactor-binding domain-containing protein [Thermoanaerobaculia bacterium]